MKKFTLIFTLLSFFSLGLIAQTIKYDRNLDGSYKSMFVIQNDKQTKVKPEINKDGTYKGLYVTFVGDSIQVDTILSLSKNNKGKIRYNPISEKWEFSNNGLIWYDFVTEGGGSFTETDPIFTSWDKSTGILIHYSQITDFDTGINTNQNVIKGSTAYSWGNHAGLYDISGTANSLLSNHLSTYDHSKLHDLTTILDSHTIDFSINGQEITGSVKTSDSITYETNIGLKLVNDSNSPGASKYYGTDSSNVKGFFSLPEPGEINTASNVGNGTGIFYQKLNNDLQFKSLVAGDNVTFDTTVSTEIKINVSSSGGGGGISGSGTTGTIAKWNTSSSLTDSSISETTPAGRTTGNAFNSDTYIESGLFIKVVSEKPSAPPSGYINIYYRNGSMYYQDSTGTETKMCETVGGSDYAYYETDIVFNFNGNDGQGYCNSNTNYGRLRKGCGIGTSALGLSTSDKKYGSASLHIDQTQYGAAGFAIDNPNGFDLLDDEWCWEAWIKITSSSFSGNTLISSGSGGDAFTMGRNSYSLCYFMPMQDTYQLFFNATVDGVTVASYYADFSIDISGSWHHLAVERDKNHSPQLRVFLDGEEQTVTTNTAFTSTPIKTVGFLSIGCGNMTPEGFNGYIDDLRFRRSCPYTTDFTPPEEW